MEALRRQFNEAIENCDFDRAEEIDKEIQNFTSTRQCTFYGEKSKYENNGFAEARQKLLKQIDDNYKHYIQLLEKTSEQFEEHCIKLESAFKRRSDQIENEYNVALSIAKSKKSPEAILLRKNAKVFGRGRDFGKARELLKQSQDLNENTQRSAIEAVETKFEEIRKRNEDQLKDDICGVMQKRKAEICVHCSNYNSTIDTFRNRHRAIQEKYHIKDEDAIEYPEIPPEYSSLNRTISSTVTQVSVKKDHTSARNENDSVSEITEAHLSDSQLSDISKEN